ncbi:hypothetical protein N2152v2_001578 [Parachlorella kessleri]
MALIEQRFATVMDSTRPQPGGGVITEQLDSQLGGLALQAPGSATEALNISYEINRILDCGLDKETLSICIALLENGVNPEALAEVVKRLRQQAAGAARQTQLQQ